MGHVRLLKGNGTNERGRIWGPICAVLVAVVRFMRHDWIFYVKFTLSSFKTQARDKLHIIWSYTFSHNDWQI